jgi:AcrR family transcriptional regulator
MNDLQVHIAIDSNLYCKNPESSDLGKKIVMNGIKMIHELGYESFTFKKLGTQIHSNESSIYRYFESKHTFLIYLVNWYWSWVEFKLELLTTNVFSAEEKLDKAIQLLTEQVKEDDTFTFINQVTLNKIIIAESVKAYHTKQVDKENEKGFYKTYKRVVQRVCDFVLEINPQFKFPHMLVSTIIEGAHHQRFFSEHLPSLTDFEEGKNNIVEFYKQLTKDALKQ